jgi:uncharacterized protein (TIGR02265 family)
MVRQGLEGIRSTAETQVARPRWVFEHTVEGLFRMALGTRLSAAAQQSLCEAGLDLSRRLLPAYSHDTWKRCLAIAADDLYPRVPRPEAWRRLGSELILGVSQTAMGRAMSSVARMLGPLRWLRRLQHTLRGLDNVVEVQLRELSPTACELHLNEVMDQPGFYQGVLEACLTQAGARQVRARVIRREGAGATLHVEWEEQHGR